MRPKEDSILEYYTDYGYRTFSSEKILCYPQKKDQFCDSPHPHPFTHKKISTCTTNLPTHFRVDIINVWNKKLLLRFSNRDNNVENPLHSQPMV